MIPVVILLIALIAIAPEIIEDASSSYDEAVATIIGMLIVVGIPTGLMIFGFTTSAKGRKLWKSVNTIGNQNYVPVSQRTVNYANTTYNRTSFVNASGQDIRAGYQQSNTAYNNTAQNSQVNIPTRNTSASPTVNNQQTTAYNTQTTVKTSATTQSPTVGCDYGRSDTGYIPHPESTDTHCVTHTPESTGNQKWKCSSCGKRNRADETFCRNCGTNRTAVY